MARLTTRTLLVLTCAGMFAALALARSLTGLL